MSLPPPPQLKSAELRAEWRNQTAEKAEPLEKNSFELLLQLIRKGGGANRPNRWVEEAKVSLLRDGARAAKAFPDGARDIALLNHAEAIRLRKAGEWQDTTPAPKWATLRQHI